MRLLLAALLLAWSALAWCGSWPRVMAVDYALGDGDSRSRAREAAIEEIRKRAAMQAGTLVASTSTVKGDKLVEEIQLIGISLVKISDVRELPTLDAGGRLTVRYTATVDLDETELQRRAAALREDGAKARSIEKLQVENRLLLATLESIRKSLAEQPGSAEVARLLDRHSSTVDALRTNAERVGTVFSQGMMVVMAEQADDRSRVAWAEVQRYIENHVVAPLLHDPRSEPAARILDVQRRPTDNAYLVRVRVDWPVDLDAAMQALQQEGTSLVGSAGPGRSYLALSLPPNTGAANFRSEAVLKLGRREVYLDISLAGMTQRIPVFYRTGDASCARRTFGTRLYMCLVPSHAPLLGTGGKPNPLLFILDEQQAREATRIEARWVYVLDGIETRIPAPLQP